MSLNPKNKAACHVCTKAALARLRSGSSRGAGDWTRNDRTARNDHLTPIGSNTLGRGTSRATNEGFSTTWLFPQLNSALQTDANPRWGAMGTPQGALIPAPDRSV